MYSYVPVCYWYVSRMYSYVPVCYWYVARMHSYVPVCYLYVLVCTRMLPDVLVCTRMLPVCTHMYSYVLVWCFSHDPRKVDFKEEKKEKEKQLRKCN